MNMLARKPVQPFLIDRRSVVSGIQVFMMRDDQTFVCVFAKMALDPR